MQHAPCWWRAALLPRRRPPPPSLPPSSSTRCVVHGMRERPRSVRGAATNTPTSAPATTPAAASTPASAWSEASHRRCGLDPRGGTRGPGRSGDVRRPAERVRVEHQLRSRAVHAGAPGEHPAARRHERPPGRPSGRRAHGDPALRASPRGGDGVRAQRAGRGLPGPDLVRVP